MPDDVAVAGWDIGGVHIKGARAVVSGGALRERRITVRPFEVWRAPDDLPEMLRAVADQLGVSDGDPMAVTMTAELSDVFRTKRDGVTHVIESVRRAFPRTGPQALSVRGELVPVEEALERPLDFAATNWVAAALYAGRFVRDCLLVDVGSTTTDIIAVRDGRLACEGRTDTARLASGELVYTGVVRSNPNTLAEMVPLRGRWCRVAGEHFTVMADVYLALARLPESAYTCPTPDGRAKTREAALERLARLVCADREQLDEEELLKIACFLAERQLRVVTDGLVQVLSRLEYGYGLPVVTAGAGAFLAATAAQRLRLTVIDGRTLWGRAGVALPAAAATELIAARLTKGATWSMPS
ncbi:MAG: H4MPT-linked C1 transfer pathway protein [Actinomycetota bacterium]|nr:MAG: H4MPT-linked C1 transfer pathway protein [Actinomycetota bacterium]